MNRSLIFAGLLASAVFGSCSKSDDKSSGTSCGNGPVCKPALASGQSAGATPASIKGTHTLTYYQVQTGAPFPQGATAMFELTADNKLIVTYNGQCVTIENPAQTSFAEVTFKDECKFNVLFAASEKNGGGLNEVNINALQGQFLGQFR